MSVSILAQSNFFAVHAVQSMPRGTVIEASLARLRATVYNLVMPNDAVTTTGLRRMKAEKNKITALTAWDFLTGTLAEAAGVDLVLVGDSLAMTVQGETDTLGITLDEIIYHTRLVARACQGPLVIADMPFMSYQVSPEQALVNSGRVLKETKARGVKIEGGRSMVRTVVKLTGAGIPVVGHVGLTPQAVHQLGGFKAQGTTVSSARELVNDAMALEKAGVCALVLEYVPAELARLISEKLEIPTLGIGSGTECDGQIQVTADLLGFGQRTPKHAKRYIDLRAILLDALVKYVGDVRDSSFPESDHAVAASPDLLEEIERDQF